MSILNDDAAPVPADTTILQDAADRIEAMLSLAPACDPASVSSALRSTAVQAELQAILAQLGPAQLLPVLYKLATGSSSEQREMLEAVFTAGSSGSGQVLRGTLQALHRQALLARVFDLGKVQALRRACRPPVQEPA